MTYLVIFVILVIIIISEELPRGVRDGERVKHTAVGRDKRNKLSGPSESNTLLIAS